MLRLCACLAYMVLIVGFTSGQPPFSHRYLATTVDAQLLVNDQQGGYYFSGCTGYFDEAFVGRTDSVGNILWVRQFTRSYPVREWIADMAVLQNGNLVVGMMVDSFGTGRSYVYATCFDPAGNNVFTKRYVNSSDTTNVPNSLVARGNEFVMTAFNYPGVNTKVLRCDASGNMIDAAELGNGFGFRIQNRGAGEFIVYQATGFPAVFVADSNLSSFQGNSFLLQTLSLSITGATSLPGGSVLLYGYCIMVGGNPSGPFIMKVSASLQFEWAKTIVIPNRPSSSLGTGVKATSAVFEAPDRINLLANQQVNGGFPCNPAIVVMDTLGNLERVVRMTVESEVNTNTVVKSTFSNGRYGFIQKWMPSSATPPNLPTFCISSVDTSFADLCYIYDTTGYTQDVPLDFDAALSLPVTSLSDQMVSDSLEITPLGFLSASCSDITLGAFHQEPVGMKYGIFPNPAGEMIEVRAPSSGTYEIMFRDLYGRMVLKTTGTGTSRLDISSLPDGIYLYELFSPAGGSVTGKLMIMK